MTNNYLDKSNYLRGLLLLASKDRKVSEREKEFLLETGKTIGFDSKFIEGAIREIFINEFIPPEPPRFSKTEFAESFIKDAIQLANIDNNFSDEEFDWIKSVAKTNELPEEFLNKEIFRFTQIPPPGKDITLEVSQFIKN